MANQVPIIPGGKSKGTPLTEASEQDILYWAKLKLQDLGNPEKANFERGNREFLAAARTELAKRGVDTAELAPPAPGATSAAQPRAAAQAQRPAAPAQTSAIQRAPTQSVQLVAASRNAEAINTMLDEAMATAHLVSPATVVAGLPPGCEVAISLVKVDPNADKGGPGDVANVGGGKFSLSANVMKKIGAAAGISWDMNASGRLDDGSDPHYVHYRAVGSVRNFDGSSRIVSGEVEIDMREGSPQLVAMKARAREGSMFESQLRDTRMFILRHAETKAKARAIADMGVKRSYTQAELQKPFKVARLMFTGRSENPELERMFAEKTADAFLGATTAMFGQQAAAPIRAVQPMLMASSGPPVAQLHAPPPVTGATVDPEDVGGFVDMEQPYGDPPEKPAAAAPPAAASSPTELKT